MRKYSKKCPKCREDMELVFTEQVGRSHMDRETKGMKILNEEETEIELRRAPSTCCPEPSCGYVGFKFDVCASCGAKCSECVRLKRKNENISCM